MKGATVYVAAQELEGLHEAASYLSAILEAASNNVTNLIDAKSCLHSLIEKAEKSRRSASRAKTIKAALRIAESGQD